MNDNTDQTRILSYARGVLDSLHWLPTSGHLADQQLNLWRWRTGYQFDGLGFGTGTGDAAILRDLVKDGFVLATGGKTKAAAHRLTWRGVLATMPTGGVDGGDILASLGKLASMRDEWIPGWRLCPAAAKWIKTKNPTDYLAELTTEQDFLTPLQIAGFVETTVVERCCYWAVTVTEAGKAAIQNPPTMHDAAATHFDFDHWQAGFDSGRTRFDRQAPERWRGCIPYSTGPAMWDGIR